MTNPEPATGKSLAIKAICIIGFINATQMVNLVFSPMTRQIGAIYPTFFAISVLISLLCLAGLWLQKRWAAMGYILLLVVNQLVLLKMGYWEITALVIPFIIAGLLYANRALLT